MIRLFVGITDRDWYEFLCARGLHEVNFWQPSGSVRFKALKPGELFLFKLHSPDDCIVGGGLFAHASIVPSSLAWESFGEGNGAASLAEMRRRIARYRRVPTDERRDDPVGCRILEQAFFLPCEAWIPMPNWWPRNTVQGKGFDASSPEGRYLWDAVRERLRSEPALPSAQVAQPVPLRYGTPQLIEPRLGQGAFRIAVTDTYERRCAVTGERTLPILDAAHIKAYAEGGAHEVSNGLLLRTDIHGLFDLGYVTVSADGRFDVSRRLKEDFDNGKHYYDLHGERLRMPCEPHHRPSPEALEWHRNNRFRG